jgi:hypothetical protein
MKLRILLAASALASSAAFAHHTPMTLQEIDAALAAGASLPVMQLTEVMKLRAEGRRLFEAGQFAEADKALVQAKKLLNLK